MNTAGKNIIRVLIVDDHPMVRDGLQSMLLNADRLEVVGEAGTAHEAVTQVEHLQPDVVLLDIQLPDEDGLSALARIKTTTPSTRVLMVTMHENAAYIQQAIAQGAAGYILKGVGRQELISAIHTVVGGGAANAIAVLLGNSHRQIPISPPLGSPPLIPAPATPPSENAATLLSPVEQDVLRLLAEGLSNKQIGVHMHWSLGTVKKYVQRVFDKLEVSDRTQAAVEGVRRGLIPY